jgi:hypothetical protein
MRLQLADHQNNLILPLLNSSICDQVEETASRMDTHTSSGALTSQILCYQHNVHKVWFPLFSTLISLYNLFNKKYCHHHVEFWRNQTLD